MSTMGVKFSIAILSLFAAVTLLSAPAAAIEDNGFSIQVTPSPLVSTVKPGQQSDLELKIYNSGTSTVDLKIQARNFEVDSKSGEVKVDDTSPARVSDWVSFSASQFRVQPGQWYTQTIHIALPKDAGYSYHFAAVISQENLPAQSSSNRLIRGSVAVFTLLNVDRPGATRRLEAAELQLDKQVYEYLPANISVTFKNTGNTIVQPYGNLFVQRGHSDTTPITTLPVNESKGYILPESTRTLSTTWADGFPRFVTDSDGRVREEWDWSNINKFRFGQYTVKLVGVYNDGQRDIPLEAEVSFWVIPWKIIGGALIILLFVLTGVWSLLHKLLSPALRRFRNRQQ
ncbi:MAG: hypothetical protein WBP12_04665 [Candidatus Saccharimonas sp.]